MLAGDQGTGVGVKAKIVDTRTGCGRKQHKVKCTCGYNNWIYVWSWAGNGWYRCRGCGKRIGYRTLEVEA